MKRKYEQLQTTKSPYEELFCLLRSRPESESIDILRRIRSGSDVGTILRQIEGGELLLQLALKPDLRL